MPLPPDLSKSESLFERIFDATLGHHTSLPKPRRYAVSLLGFAGYLALATYSYGFAALFYGILQRWGIEEPSPGELADAYVWAGICGALALGTFAIWWWYLGPAPLQTWSTHVWLPIGIVSVALALDRRRRPPTATESIGRALSAAGRRHRRDTPPPTPPEA